MDHLNKPGTEHSHASHLSNAALGAASEKREEEKKKESVRLFNLQRRMLAHFRKYQETGDKFRLKKIQAIVDKEGKPFIIKIEKPAGKITFRPKLFDPIVENEI